MYSFRRLSNYAVLWTKLALHPGKYGGRGQNLEARQHTRQPCNAHAFRQDCVFSCVLARALETRERSLFGCNCLSLPSPRCCVLFLLHTCSTRQICLLLLISAPRSFQAHIITFSSTQQELEILNTASQPLRERKSHEEATSNTAHTTAHSSCSNANCRSDTLDICS